MANAPFRMEFERKFWVRNGGPEHYDVVNLFQPGESQRSKTTRLVKEVLRVRQDGDPLCQTRIDRQDVGQTPEDFARYVSKYISKPYTTSRTVS